MPKRSRAEKLKDIEDVNMLLCDYIEQEVLPTLHYMHRKDSIYYQGMQ